MSKPEWLFDRDHEWTDLERFVSAEGPRVGLVYGRRRQGKSFLLRALADAHRGFYHQALEEEREPALAGFGAAIAADAGLAGAIAYPDWRAAMRDAVARTGSPRPIVLDEFPYLLAKSPELPSVIQALFDDARSGAMPAFRLIICGSAMSVMSQLLTGQRALRGRAALELLIEPFDFREAARYWGIADPETAFLVHSVVGGTPGYRPLLDNSAPVDPASFADWLFEGVLNPSSALFREAEYLLTEDPVISDRALYQSVLAAIAAGNTTRSAVGGVLRRDESALRHPLLVLERAGFIARDDDLWRAKRPLLRLVDPYLRFYMAIVRRNLARFEGRDTARAWAQSQDAFAAQVLGPHFEELARTWTRRFAGAATLGGTPSLVGHTQVNDRVGRTALELDVVAVEGSLEATRPRVLAVGEAKGGLAIRTLADLHKLERGRTILSERLDAAGARLLLFSRGGFNPDLTSEAARRSDVELVDLARLYGGE